MTLADRIIEPQPDDARRTRAGHPKGYEPGVKYDPDERPIEVTLPECPRVESHRSYRESIEAFLGQPLDAGARLVLREASFDPVAWSRYQQGDDALTVPVWRPRFGIVYDEPAGARIDPVEVLRELRKGARRGAPKPAHDGAATLGVVWSDWQLFKGEGGGIAATLERLDTAFDGVAERARELRKIGRAPGELLVVGNGDIVEGCTIFGNQAFTIEGDRREQMRAAVTIILDGLDRLAPLFTRVRVMAVGGNHGENRIKGRMTTAHDNDDVAAFEHAATAAARDPRLGHVSFYLARSETSKTIDVNGWIFAATHGQVFTGAGTPEQKAYRWYSGQAAGRLPAGDADVLLTAHYHHEASANWGACLWKQTGAMDGGSQHFTDTTGKHAAPAMTTWVTTTEKRWQDEQLL